MAEPVTETVTAQDIRFIYCPCASSEEAARIAQKLVEEKLVACVNILPQIRSVYRWEGKTVTDSEVAIIGKTHRNRLDDAMKRIHDLHSYDLPAITAFAPSDGFVPFCQWIDDEVS